MLYHETNAVLWTHRRKSSSPVRGFRAVFMKEITFEYRLKGRVGFDIVGEHTVWAKLIGIKLWHVQGIKSSQYRHQHVLVDGAAGWDLAGCGESWKPRARNAALSLSTIGTSYIFSGENTGNIQSSLEKWVAAGEGIKERSQYKGQGQWGSWRAASIIQPLDDASLGPRKADRGENAISYCMWVVREV